MELVLDINKGLNESVDVHIEGLNEFSEARKELLTLEMASLNVEKELIMYEGYLIESNNLPVVYSKQSKYGDVEEAEVVDKKSNDTDSSNKADVKEKMKKLWEAFIAFINTVGAKLKNALLRAVAGVKKVNSIEDEYSKLDSAKKQEALNKTGYKEASVTEIDVKNITNKLKTAFQSRDTTSMNSLITECETIVKNIGEINSKISSDKIVPNISVTKTMSDIVRNIYPSLEAEMKKAKSEAKSEKLSADKIAIIKKGILATIRLINSALGFCMTVIRQKNYILRKAK